MKIFKWRIYSKNRVEKIIQLIGGGEDDRNMAKLLLIPPPKEEVTEDLYPKYRIRVCVERVHMEKKIDKDSRWNDETSEYYRNEPQKSSAIENMKKNIAASKIDDEKRREKAKFKEYFIES